MRRNGKIKIGAVLSSGGVGQRGAAVRLQRELAGGWILKMEKPRLSRRRSLEHKTLPRYFRTAQQGLSAT